MTFFKYWERGTIRLESFASKNVTQEWKGNQDIFRWMKTKRIGHQQTYPKRIAKENSPNRKETMKEGNLEN